MSRDQLVYLVDDDPSILKALKRLFVLAGFRCETFATAREFREYRDFKSPSCVVMDVQLPDQSGLELHRELKERIGPVSIVFITGHGNIALAVQAMQDGAVHFLAKPFDNNELLAAVRQGLHKAEQEQAAINESNRRKERLDSLTPREQEIFRLVASGMANKTIAMKLDVSLQTVKLHRGRVMQKLQLDSIADLVRIAEKAGPLSANR